MNQKSGRDNRDLEEKLKRVEEEVEIYEAELERLRAQEKEKNTRLEKKIRMEKQETLGYVEMGRERQRQESKGERRGMGRKKQRGENQGDG